MACLNDNCGKLKELKRKVINLEIHVLLLYILIILLIITGVLK